MTAGSLECGVWCPVSEGSREVWTPDSRLRTPDSELSYPFTAYTLTLEA